jgi:leader peptidase (prepilin peptidase)/N-methyltransferase
VCNLHDWPLKSGQSWAIDRGFFPPTWWIVWLFHAILFSFLMVAAACDLDGREIPLALTMTGTAIGLIGSVVLAWPWPLLPEEAMPSPNAMVIPGREWQGQIIHPGLYAWPVWGPLPAGLEPGDWKTGLATGLAGALVGTFMMRGVAFLFSRGLGREALGLGDADLMMMAGAFLGWQPVVVAFFLSVIPALVFGVVQMAVKRDNELPFGPSLAAGIVLTFLCWRWIGREMQPFFFWGAMLAAVVVLGAVFMLLSSYIIRISRRSSSA